MMLELANIQMPAYTDWMEILQHPHVVLCHLAEDLARTSMVCSSARATFHQMIYKDEVKRGEGINKDRLIYLAARRRFAFFGMHDQYTHELCVCEQCMVSINYDAEILKLSDYWCSGCQERRVGSWFSSPSTTKELADILTGRMHAHNGTSLYPYPLTYTFPYPWDTYLPSLSGATIDALAEAQLD
jgi:hypothetical protein